MTDICIDYIYYYCWEKKKTKIEPTEESPEEKPAKTRTYTVLSLMTIIIIILMLYDVRNMLSMYIIS